MISYSSCVGSDPSVPPSMGDTDGHGSAEEGQPALGFLDIDLSRTGRRPRGVQQHPGGRVVVTFPKGSREDGAPLDNDPAVCLCTTPPPPHAAQRQETHTLLPRRVNGRMDFFLLLCPIYLVLIGITLLPRCSGGEGGGGGGGRGKHESVMRFRRRCTM